MAPKSGFGTPVFSRPIGITRYFSIGVNPVLEGQAAAGQQRCRFVVNVWIEAAARSAVLLLSRQSLQERVVFGVVYFVCLRD